ncbi:MAG: deoxyribodipyrimidine photolyase, partial [Gemmatimonadetes bacterium]|nr:deoxyribodipyrimidine photolyase [Gemmatimonadota bacterium]NIV25454.1 deoxyribodipyrimidine photolyase [Gemmatimonadota bacterium]NIW75701.1 deoxyribodipyrimidine photolyase [Gemmatimonadota bacterium]NIY37381.1 deoxyribodipyrimidine photolyase [Gemmatimonadota bacterium]NIY45517.1 deoxyribodipyrimidine photolyase [Gemmatimonadota bacterium]
LERRLPVDHSVPPIDASGGPVAAARALGRFIEEGLPRYAEAAREPEAGATSGLSPYLHFGHISSQAIFGALIEREAWDVDRLSG